MNIYISDKDLEKSLEELIFETEGLFNSITGILLENGLTISLMESVSSGLIASLLTDKEGASKILRGSFVSYSNEAKILFGVNEEIIKKYGVYSFETSDKMAECAMKSFSANIGIGITGSLSNPDPENSDSVPGETYLSIIINKDGISEYRNFKIHVPKAERLKGKFILANAVAGCLLPLVSGAAEKD